MLAAVCAGCRAPDPALQPLLDQQCVAAQAQPGEFSVVAPVDGTLRFLVEQRGLSVLATSDGQVQQAAESPIPRLGTIVLALAVEGGKPHRLLVQPQDTPGVQGAYCVRADLIPRADGSRATATILLSDAAQATHRHDWGAAFDAYQRAARRFDTLSAPGAAGGARHAMAQLAYLRLDRKRDSYALAGEALTALAGRSGPGIRGALLALQAKALLESTGNDLRLVAPQVSALQAAARRELALDPAAARELPRLDIMSGFLEYRLDRLASGERLFAGAAAQCRELEDWECYAIASQNLAALALESRNYTGALTSFAALLKELPAEVDPKLRADIWNNLGTLQGLAGLYSDSERSHANAMGEYAAIGDCQGLRRTLARSGALLVQLGSLSDAVSDLGEAATFDCAELLERAGNRAMQRDPRGSPALPRAGQDAMDDQGSPCSGSLDPTRLATDNRVTVLNALLSLAEALQLQSHPSAAGVCLEAAARYAVTARSQMKLSAARGELYLEKDQAADARAAFEQALRIADTARLPQAHQDRGMAELGVARASLLSGDVPEAVQRAARTLRTSAVRGDLASMVTALRLLASGQRAAGKPQEATHTLQAAVRLIQNVPINELDPEQRAIYLASQYSAFAQLTDLDASQADADPHQATAAFAISELGRARSLRYAVSQSVRNATENSLSSSAYQKMLQSISHASAAESSPDPAVLVTAIDHAAQVDSEPVQLDEARLANTLGALHANLIEYAVGADDMFGFVLNASGLHVLRLGRRQLISAAAAELQDRLRDAETPASELHEAARNLAALVLWPLEPLLSGERLIIVPDDGLHTVPFSALPWSARVSDGHVLQHAEVAIAPSALFLMQLGDRPAFGRPRAAQHSAPRVALLGDPVFRLADWQRECRDAHPQPENGATLMRSTTGWTQSLPRLPGSRAEVQMVARLAQQRRPGSHIEELLGCGAVPDALRTAASGHLDLLHIATHARVDSQRPRLSALALTPEDRGGHIVSSFGLLDILGLRLDSSLVVLSACDTSRGRLLPGEGVLGPAQAFLQAGAAAVIASYWRVEDEATTRFMRQFYRYLFADHLPAATALRRAQLDEARNASPHEWAAFSLYGWPDRDL